MKSPFLIMTAIVVLLCGGAAFAARNPERADVVSISKSSALAGKIEALDLDLLGDWNGQLFVLARPADLEKLEREQVVYYSASAPGNAPFRTDGFSRRGPNGAYHSYLELEADLLFLQRQHPDIVKVFDLGETFEKRRIYALKISDHVEREEPEAKVLFLGCHHAREWISIEVPFRLGKYLAENYATDPDVQRLVDNSEIWIIPLVNPDGLEYTIHTYRYWRKNRHDLGKGNFGVDLNRNYSYKWGADDEGSSPNPASDVYRGSMPFSEPETRAVRDLFLKKDFQALVSYHSFSQVILYPWGYTRDPSDKETEMKDIAARMSGAIQAVNGSVYPFGESGQALYLTNGDATDWTYGTSGIPSFTIELPPVDELYGGFFNREEDILPIFEENLPAMVLLIDYAIQNYRSVSASPFDLRTLFLKKD